MRRLLSILLFLTLPTLASSATLTATPGTLRSQLAQMGPGDTLQLQPGTYAPITTATHRVPSGTSWSDAPRIVGGPGVIVRGIGLTGNVRYLIVSNVVVDCGWQSREGVYISNGAGFIRMQESEIKHCTAQGVLVPKASRGYNEFLRLDVHHNGEREHYDHGIYISAANNLIADSRIHHNAAYGVHVYSSGSFTAHRNRVLGNEIYANGQLAGSSYGILVASGQGTVISHNKVRGNKGGITAAYRVQDAVICQNEIVDNASYGLRIHGDATRTRLVANRLSDNAAAVRDDSGSTQVQDSGSECPTLPEGELPGDGPVATQPHLPRRLRLLAQP